MIVHSAAYLAAAVTFLVLDGLWLGVVARSFYASRLGGLMAPQVSIAPAVAFYLLYVAGVVIFCIRPALADDSWRMALVHGALLGVLAYGTYDLTNLATLKGWPLDMSLVDIAWGAVITAAAATAGFHAARYVG